MDYRYHLVTDDEGWARVASDIGVFPTPIPGGVCWEIQMRGDAHRVVHLGRLGLVADASVAEALWRLAQEVRCD